jgi:hypothetical protein
MKKILVMIIITIYTSFAWAGENIYRRSATITSLSPGQATSSLIEMNMNVEAGIFLSLACTTDDTNVGSGFDIYIYDNDLDGTNTERQWYADADRDSNTVLAFSKSISATTWRDDTTLPSFSCEDTTNTKSLYIGAYMDAGANTGTINCEFRYIGRRLKNLGAVDTEWLAD